MRVLFDVASLGISDHPGLTRAGVFRTTQGFVDEVLRRSDLDPWFVAADSWFCHVQLAHHVRGGGLPAERVLTSWEHPSVPTDEALDLIDVAIDAGERSPTGTRAMQTLTLLNHTARRTSLPGAWDVVHSLRHPLPPRTVVDAPVRAVNVYDLIPLLHGEFCDEGAVHTINAILDSVDTGHDAVLCPSESARGDLVDHLDLDPSRTRVIPLGLDGTMFRPETDRGRITEVLTRHGVGADRYLLGVCTIEPRKNLARLLAAHGALVSSGTTPDLRLVLVGATGWKTERTFAALADHPAPDTVTLTGYVPDEDLAPLYTGAAAFVYPSLYEGFGLPVLEAMRCGTPVVTSEVSSLPEITGDTAVLVDPTDTDAIAAGIRRALAEPGRGAAGRVRSLAFSWRRTVDETVRAYGTLRDLYTPPAGEAR